jgi:hypothetical protein
LQVLIFKESDRNGETAGFLAEEKVGDRVVDPGW